MRIAFVIPALNESSEIGSVVSRLRVCGTPIVVDDGSTDGTGWIARNNGAIVVTHKVNRGYDAALTSGLCRALADNFDVAITVDGDGQHDTSRIERFLSGFDDGADVVVGVRDRLQRFSETLFAKVATMLWGIQDPLCGMKGYRLARLRDTLELCNYPSVGTELLVRAARSGLSIVQVPIVTLPRHGRSRFGDGLRANLLIIRALILGLLIAKPLPETR